MTKRKAQETDLAEEQRVAKVLEGIDSVSGDDGLDTITLSTGVVLKLKPVSKWLIKSVNNQFEQPEVPTQYIKDLGKEVENPSHPKYKEAMERYMVEIGNATTDVCILRGTELLEKPDDVIGHESEECALEMKTLGFKDTENLRSRYLYWVKYIAAPLDNDMNRLMGALGRLTGIAEADVLEAVARFRSAKKQ